MKDKKYKVEYDNGEYYPMYRRLWLGFIPRWVYITRTTYGMGNGYTEVVKYPTLEGAEGHIEYIKTKTIEEVEWTQPHVH